MTARKNISLSSGFRYLLCFLFWVATGFTATAQRVPFYNLNIENGLVQSQVTCMTQDKMGHLWVGTLGGISRYDGSMFVNYTVRDGLVNNVVTTLTMDSSNRLWVGTMGGISIFDGAHFKNISTARIMPKGIYNIRMTKTDTVWCSGSGKLCYILKNQVHEMPIPVRDSMVSSIYTDKDGLWVALTRGAVLHYKNRRWDSVSVPGLSNNARLVVYKFRPTKTHGTLLLTNAGVLLLRPDSIVRPDLSSHVLDNLPIMLSAAEDGQHNIWFGTNSGVIRTNDTSIQIYNKKNGLSDNTFDDIFSDEEGNVWLASDGQGLFRFSGSLFTGLDESVGLPSAQIMSIAATRNGMLYLGTYDAGLYAYQNGQSGKIIIPGGLTPMITTLAVRGNELWIGSKGYGAWRYDYRGFKSYTAPARGFPSNFISCMYTDTTGKLFVGFANGAVYLYKDTFRKVPLRGNSVEAFIQIGADSILMATNEGLKLFNAGTVSSFITHAAPDSSVAQCFTMRGNQLWIGTSDNGLICYDLKTHVYNTYNKSNGLHSDFIYNLVTDNEGNVWAGTGFGIHKISFSSGSPVIYFFGREQGVTGMESNHNAVFKMNDGSIWFGTTNGALHYQPKSKMVTPHPISIVMQSVKVFGENITNQNWYDSTDTWYGVPYHLELPYQKNNITFVFQAVSLSGAGQLRYRYRIDGLEAPWSDWSATNAVTYSALPPGNYTFRVQCTTDDGTVKELTYPFIIITPFQKTNLFRLLILAACILLGVIMQYIANKRKQNRLLMVEKLRREEQAKVRQRTAEDFHDEVGNKLTRINVLTNVLKSKIGDVNPDTKRIIDQIQDNTAQLYSGTRDILWSLKPSNDTLYEVVHRLRDFGGELYQDTEVNFTFTGTDERWRNFRLPMDVSRNLIMIFKEAMNNSLKYSGATEVSLDAVIKQKDVLHIIFRDNGKGFDILTAKKGHGINNMQVRAERIHGRLYIDSAKDRGTIISLSFKIPLMK